MTKSNERHPSLRDSDPRGSPDPESRSPVAFGLIVIGDEVLNGGRTDKHLAAFKARLAARGHGLAWHWLLPDQPSVLTEHLRFSLRLGGPVFVCGGIGATPDDHTRYCAAAAIGVELVRHPEAAALIEGRFGETAYPLRIRMADLPAGCGLIPNPINQIPGFSLQAHWFLPGFPQMAWPMADWVLARHYGRADPLEEASLRVLGVAESQLIPLMEELEGCFPRLKLFSLPHLGENPHILLGFRGRGGLDQAMQALRERLKRAGISFQPGGD